MPTKRKRKKENVDLGVGNQHVAYINGDPSDSIKEIQEMLETCCKYIKQQHGTSWRESFFQRSLAFELQQRGFDVSMEVAYPVYYTSTTGKTTSVGNVFIDILTPDFAIECKRGKNLSGNSIKQATLYSTILKKPCFLVFSI